MKKILLFIFVLLEITITGFSQIPMERYYGYDAVGNRERRSIVVLDKKSDFISNSDSTDTDSNSFYINEIGNINVKIYPNPTTGEISIRVENINDFISGNLVLYSIDGKLLKKYNMTQPEQNIDLSEYVNGIYILKIKINEYDQEWKIIKQ